MIRFQRSIRAARGRNPEAMEWAKEIAEYVNNKQPKYKVQAFATRFGDLGVLVWQVDLEDLATLDTYQQAVGADQGYWDLIKKGTDLFIEGTTFDSVFDPL